jgi:AraC-like DNA-binding protein
MSPRYADVRRPVAESPARYCEYRPPPHLRDRVQCFWRVDTGPRPGFTQPVLPDGCTDIVWIGARAPILAGPATQRIDVPLPGGVDVVGVRFKPGWAASSLGVAADGLLNTHYVALDDIWSGSESALLALMPRAATERELARSFMPKMRALANIVTRRVLHQSKPDASVLCGVQRLARGEGDVERIAREIGVSTRHLHRQFRTAVGYGPKAFHRIMRLQRLFWAASHGCDARDLAELAAHVGYADQAHMCREVRTLTNQTPQVVLGTVRGPEVVLSDLFNTADERSGILLPHETARHPDHPRCR